MKTQRLLVMGLMVLALWGAGSAAPEAATLNGFELQSDEHSVQVIVKTDERTTYKTETNGHQFAVVLENTQVSPEQVKNGLPVVLDNRNKFIGRAVPLSDNRVKIVLPNLPASQYSVSVIQKHESNVASSRPVILRPRSPVALEESPASEWADEAAPPDEWIPLRPAHRKAMTQRPRSTTRPRMNVVRHSAPVRPKAVPVQPRIAQAPAPRQVATPVASAKPAPQTLAETGLNTLALEEPADKPASIPTRTPLPEIEEGAEIIESEVSPASTPTVAPVATPPQAKARAPRTRLLPGLHLPTDQLSFWLMVSGGVVFGLGFCTLLVLLIVLRRRQRRPLATVTPLPVEQPWPTAQEAATDSSAQPLPVETGAPPRSSFSAQSGWKTPGLQPVGVTALRFPATRRRERVLSFSSRKTS